MERMDMHSRNEYLKVLRESYFKVKARKEKTQLLDEYCRNTGQVRKYIIRKIHSQNSLPSKASTIPPPKLRGKRGGLKLGLRHHGPRLWWLVSR
jgi:hypothetical protein